MSHTNETQTKKPLSWHAGGSVRDNRKLCIGGAYMLPVFILDSNPHTFSFLTVKYITAHGCLQRLRQKHNKSCASSLATGCDILKLMRRFSEIWQKVPKAVRKPLVFAVGLSIVVAGITMLVLPGPGWAAIFLGFAVLATEFAFAGKARDWLVAQLKSLIR
jgi:hypothetical protein